MSLIGCSIASTRVLFEFASLFCPAITKTGARNRREMELKCSLIVRASRRGENAFTEPCDSNFDGIVWRFMPAQSCGKREITSET